MARLGLADSGHELDIDGYLATADLEPTIRTFALTPVGTGNVTLHITAFDFSVVSRLVARSAVVAALDAATSVDPRARGAGERALSDTLRRYR